MTGVIELIDDTPEVIQEAGGQTASVRIMFTLSPVAFSATCALQELEPTAVDCEFMTNYYDYVCVCVCVCVYYISLSLLQVLQEKLRLLVYQRIVLCLSF